MAAEQEPVSELFEVSSERLQTHNMTTANRLLWLINSQSFMLGTYAGLSIFMSPTPQLHVKAQMLGLALPTLGIIVSFFTLTDIITSTSEINKIAQNYKQYNKEHDQQLGFPTLNGNLLQRILERFSPIAVTLVFLVLWVFLIMHDYKLL